MKAFVINLDERADRLARMARQLQGLGLAWLRMPAVRIMPQEFASHTARLRAFAHLGGVLPSLGQVGCYYSHRKIWQTMVDENIALALVLEDDAEPLQWDEAVLTLDIAQHGIDLLRLECVAGYAQNYRPSGLKLAGRDVTRDTSWGSAAYVITQAGARKCLAAGRFWFVIDDFEVWSSVYGLKTALLLPPLFQQRDNADTNIASPYPLRQTFVTRLKKVIAQAADWLLIARERRRILQGQPAG